MSTSSRVPHSSSSSTPDLTFLFVALLLLGLASFVFLQAVFTGQFILSPIAISAFGLNVHWYGLFIMVSIAIAIPWTVARAIARGLNPAATETVLWWAVVGGIVGARALFVLQTLPLYRTAPLRMFAIMDGGLSIHGALLGGFLTAFAAAAWFNRSLSRAAAIRFWLLADAAVPPLLFGMVVGRFGNLFNYELFGPPARVPWRMFVPQAFRPVEFADYRYFHPAFLYDAMGNALVLGLVLANEHRAKYPGEPVLWFFLGTATVRFLVEFWRIGAPAAGNLTSAQLVSIVIAVAAGLLTTLRRVRLSTVN